MAIIGLGGIGQGVAYDLACMGVRKFLLLDKGAVAMQQMVHMGIAPHHVGMSKVQVMRLRLLKEFPQMTVETRWGNVMHGRQPERISMGSQV